MSTGVMNRHFYVQGIRITNTVDRNGMSSLLNLKTGQNYAADTDTDIT